MAYLESSWIPLSLGFDEINPQMFNHTYLLDPTPVSVVNVIYYCEVVHILVWLYDKSLLGLLGTVHSLTLAELNRQLRTEEVSRIFSTYPEYIYIHPEAVRKIQETFENPQLPLTN